MGQILPDERDTTPAGQYLSVRAPHPAVGPRVISSASLNSNSQFYLVCAANPPPVVDLSRSLAQRAARRVFAKPIVEFLTIRFGILAVVFRVGMALFVVQLFLDHCATTAVLPVLITSCSMSVISTMVLLSTDIVGLLMKNYEFWFLTLFNTLNWVVIAIVFQDLRALSCGSAWFAFQSAIIVDANHRTLRTTVGSVVVGGPLLVTIAAMVAAKTIKDADYFDLKISGRTVGQASDLISFTTSTLALFFLKLLVLKWTYRHRSMSGLRNIRCVTLKSMLRLVPMAELSMKCREAVRPVMGTDRSDKQPLRTSRLRLGVIDARRTVLPYRIWGNAPKWILRNASRLRILFYCVGIASFGMLTFDTLLKFNDMLIHSSASSRSAQDGQLKRLVPVGADLVLLVLSSVSTVVFCGSFILMLQRDLLRGLFWNFDFVFSATQPLIFHICLCDMQRWNPEIVLLCIMWEVWFFWLLTLDALTPDVKRCIFCFRKRMAAPVLFSVIVGTGATGLFVLFIPELGFRDRVVWSHTFSSGVTFSVRTQTILVGRSITVVLWCTRQVYLLLTRRDDELNLIHGTMEYQTPFPVIPLRRSTLVPTVNGLALDPLSQRLF